MNLSENTAFTYVRECCAVAEEVLIDDICAAINENRDSV